MQINYDWPKLTLESFRRLPIDMRIALVDHVRKLYDENDDARQAADEIRELIKKAPGDWVSPYHHGWGTGIRNYMRELYTDDELPNTPYDDDRGEFKNYDDYYIGIVEVALKEGIYHMLNDKEKV